MAGINGNRKGQAFIMGTIIFSTLVILVMLSSGPSILGSETNTNRFFSQTLDKSSDVFNDAITENRSIEKAERSMYSYNRFLERKSLEKGITYRSYDLIVLPEKGNASFINYYGRALRVKLWIDGSWENQTVQPEQSFRKNFSPGTVSARLMIRNQHDHKFDTASPMLLKHSVMDSEDERWENTLLG